MAEILSLDHVALHSKGSSLVLGLEAGQSLCVVGPPASGKSRLLSIISKLERPVRGTVHTPAKIDVAVREDPSRRTKPLALARRASRDASRAGEVLTALGLWEVRQRPVSHLSEAQIAACNLIAALAGDAPMFVLDGNLDSLDPWTLSGTMKLIQGRLAQGGVAVISTNRPDLVERFDAVIVLKDQSVVFAGSPEELRMRGPERRIEISEADFSGVKALVEPFEITVREVNGGIQMEAKEGQTIAAKLLLEGYGTTRFVYLHRQSIEDALKELVG